MTDEITDISRRRFLARTEETPLFSRVMAQAVMLREPLWAGTRAVVSALMAVICGAVVLAAMGGVAAVVAHGNLPQPTAALRTLAQLLKDPFFDGGPNDKGIGLQLLASLGRVFLGFGLGAVVAIPMGVLLGVSPLVRRFIDPVVQILRPVSPLAWFPIGVALFNGGASAAIFVIFITSLWPTVLNTALGVGSVPESYRNVAQVFQFSHWKYLTRVLLPYSLPHIMTGLRLSMGIAWLVLVAAEMLSVNTGIGFFVWDSWNARSLERVMAAILLIGVVGLVLDRVFGYLVQRFSYGEAV